ncbi:C-type isolectin Sp-CL4-like [Aulostomus maculatus]
MRPVVVTAMVLLELLVYMPGPATGNYWVEVINLCWRVPFVPCGGDWRKLDDKRCTKLFREMLTFDEAESACKMEGGTLASIKSEAQQDQVFCMGIEDQGMSQYWIGARRQAGGFHWTDGSGLMTFKKWGHGQPDNWGDREDCVMINTDHWGRWNDLTCTDKRRFICQKAA